MNKNEQNIIQILKTKTSNKYGDTQEPFTEKVYNELSDFPIVENDSLTTLHKNIEMLTDLHSRYSFIMREVSYLLKV